MNEDCNHGEGFICARCEPDRIAAILREEYARLDRKYYWSPPEPYDIEKVRRRTPYD